MRKDMFKVIVERPRWAYRQATKSKLRYDKCEDRSHVTGRRLVAEVGNRKELNENLAPLKRYLHKQVGRPWDDVFSEICQHLDTGSTVKMHVREHLDDFVERKVRCDDDGTLWSTNGWGAVKKLVDSWVELYVDPRDGIVKETRKLCKRVGVPFGRFEAKYEQPKFIRKVGDLKWHVRISGIWYLVELSAPPISKHGYMLSDSEFHQALCENSWRRHDRWSVVQKIQFSHKTLKALGLSNDYKAGSNPYG